MRGGVLRGPNIRPDCKPPNSSDQYQKSCTGSSVRNCHTLPKFDSGQRRGSSRLKRNEVASMGSKCVRREPMHAGSSSSEECFSQPEYLLST